jgi:hypothetical protein
MKDFIVALDEYIIRSQDILTELLSTQKATTTSQSPSVESPAQVQGITLLVQRPWMKA